MFDELKTMTEQELRETKVPWLKNVKELNTYISGLTNREHDYGTCVYAMSMAALATFYYVSSKLGVTGFQASCADLDFLSRSRGYKHGCAITDYNNLLYPQYEGRIPGFWTLIEENIIYFRKEAKKLLLEHPEANFNVKKHWRKLADWRL
jgi:hypothetical protein